jgi:predicted nucleic acid-binding protein
MGLILDTGVFVVGERRGLRLPALLLELQQRFGAQPMDISVITIAELAHGIYRANSPQLSNKRSDFVDAISNQLTVHDLTQDLEKLVGRIEGEQAALGNTIAFEDLAIGATALALDFGVLTGNSKHFNLIPDLPVLTL